MRARKARASGTLSRPRGAQQTARANAHPASRPPDSRPPAVLGSGPGAGPAPGVGLGRALAIAAPASDPSVTMSAVIEMRKQVEMKFPCTWGGRREGAGRKKKPGAGVSHAERPWLD